MHAAPESTWSLYAFAEVAPSGQSADAVTCFLSASYSNVGFWGGLGCRRSRRSRCRGFFDYISR